MPKDSNGEYRGIAFIEYTHDVTVPYALQLLADLKLYGKPMYLKSRNNQSAAPMRPETIEATHPLMTASSALRSGISVPPMLMDNMRPQRRMPPIASNLSNPFEQINDPALLLALSANFQQPGTHHMFGQYSHHQGNGFRGQNEDHFKMSRGNPYNDGNQHQSANPYRDNRRDNRDRDHGRSGRDWTNGNNHKSKHHSRSRRT